MRPRNVFFQKVLLQTYSKKYSKYKKPIIILIFFLDDLLLSEEYDGMQTFFRSFVHLWLRKIIADNIVLQGDQSIRSILQ